MRFLLATAMALVLTRPDWTMAELDAAYYENSVVPLLVGLIPAEKLAIDPTQPAYTQFGEGSQSLDNLYQARVYFVSEGAGWGNLMGYTTDGSGTTQGTGGIAFPDASVPIVNPGEFVDLGTFAAGTLLDFYLVLDANNYLGQGILGTVSTQPGGNSDMLADHTIQLLSHLGTNGNTYLVYGFEDQPNLGDRDFNDIVFALELSPVPEPGTLALAALGLLAIVALHSRQRG